MGKLNMKPRKKVRARNKDGTLKGDDPSTPQNEAWTTEIVTKKRGRPKKKDS